MDFWSDKRVVVTGGAGFLGSFVVDKLKERHVKDVFVPVFEKYDFREAESVRKMLQDSRPDIIIHLAAKMGGIGANRQAPAEFYYDNLMIGTNILHESYKFGVEKIIAASSVCAYPKYTPVPFKEEDVWNGYPEETNGPYGIAKRMLLVQSQAYRTQYGLNSVVLLLVNLYGPRDNFNMQSSHVIPALIRKCLEAKESGKDHIEVWGSGSATREFLYVEDAADAFLLAAENYNKSEPVNLGSGIEIGIRDLVVLITRLIGYEGDIIWDKSKPDGQPRRFLDTTKAEQLFGFKAKTSFEEGLKKTIDWYMEKRNFID